jgi:DNA-binding transcriptional LysR family regulator
VDRKQLGNVDLNLLVALDALLTERSVTGAAERLGRSQPALSASLQRLRRRFGDDLLVRVGNQYELTALAVQLRRRTALVLSEIERLFETRANFDPSGSDREFTIVTSDYGVSALGPALSKLLASEAPDVRVRYLQVNDDFVDDAPESLRTVDGIMLPRGFLVDLPSVTLYQDRWVCIVAADNERVGEELTMELLADLPWVLSFHRPTAYSPAARQLQLLGVELQASIVVEGFMTVPSLIAGTERVGLVQKLLADTVAGPDLRVLECPFDPPPLVEAFWWHPTLDQDPGHAWFRSALTRAGDQLG